MAIVEGKCWLEKLQDDLRAQIAPAFAQARSRFTAFAYVGALLAEPEDRRSCWQLAEAAGHLTPRRMQALLAEHAWDWRARQYAGITGQVGNCQTVVFTAYVTARGHALYDFRLYLPRAWCQDKQRRERAKVPAEVEFKTKTEQGTEMVTAAIGAGTSSSVA